MQKRIYYYDIVRVLACFLVVGNHSNNGVFLHNAPSVSWYLSVLHFYICKAGAPLFIMLSGALMLGRDYTYRQIITKVIKTIVALILFSLAMNLLQNKGFSGFSLLVFIKDIINKPVTIVYWYLYMVIGLYLMSPLLRKLVTGLKKADAVYFATLWVLFAALLPLPGIFFGYEPTGWLYFPLFTSFVGYYIIGYVVSKEGLISTSKKTAALSWLLICVFLAISVLETVHEHSSGQIVLKLDNIRLITTVCVSVPMFYLTLRCFSGRDIPVRLKSALGVVSDATLGIYLIHPMVIQCARHVMDNVFLAFNSIIATVICQISIFAISLFIALVLRKIPLIKRIV